MAPRAGNLGKRFCECQETEPDTSTGLLEITQHSCLFQRLPATPSSTTEGCVPLFNMPSIALLASPQLPVFNFSLSLEIQANSNTVMHKPSRSCPGSSLPSQVTSVPHSQWPWPSTASATHSGLFLQQMFAQSRQSLCLPCNPHLHFPIFCTFRPTPLPGCFSHSNHLREGVFMPSLLTHQCTSP